MTMIDRFIAAGINETTARDYFTRGWVRVNGEPATDPEATVEADSALTIMPY